jgi:amino acid transporter
VVGFGLANMKALAADSAPLNTLALKFGSPTFATVLDLAAAISAFSCVLGCLSAAARMLFAIGRAGLAPPLGTAHPQHGTPAAAVLTLGIIMIAGVVLWAPFVGAGDYYGDMGTIGTLSLILVYMAVTGAEAVDAGRTRRSTWAVFGAAGTIILLWPLYNSVYPVPAYPGNLWPYVVIVYLVIGVVMLFARPALARAPLSFAEPSLKNLS